MPRTSSAPNKLALERAKSERLRNLKIEIDKLKRSIKAKNDVIARTPKGERLPH